MSVQSGGSILVPEGSTLTQCVHDRTGSLCLTASASTSGTHTVQVCIATHSDFVPVASWNVDSAVTSVAWAAPEYGKLVAVGTQAGHVQLWEFKSLETHSKNQGNGGQYTLTATLTGFALGVREVQFAPPQMGLVLAVLGEDGYLSVFEADRVLEPSSWGLHSRFQAGEPRSCLAFTWRPFSPGSAPFLCIASGQGAHLWYYLAAFSSWQRATVLEAGGAVSCVAWASALGRPQELVAVSCGPSTQVFGLSGDACSGTMQSQQLAELVHAAPVWMCEYDAYGNQLAISTDDQTVHVYRAGMVGKFEKVAIITGE